MVLPMEQIVGPFLGSTFAYQLQCLNERSTLMPPEVQEVFVSGFSSWDGCTASNNMYTPKKMSGSFL